MRDEQIHSDNVYDDWDDDIEIVDLEALDVDAQKAPIPVWSQPVLRWQHSFTRRRWRTIASTCSLLLVLLVLALSLHTTLTFLATVRNTLAARLVHQQPLLQEHLPTPVTITPSLVIPLAQNGFSCVTSEAWSPDSTAIALLGYTAGCEYNSDSAVGLATIQDARTGQRIVQLRPDAPIKKAFYAQFPAIHDSLILYYQDATWSPDRIHLALLFSLHTQSEVNGAQFSGVLLYDQKHKSIRVLLQHIENVPMYVVSESSYEEWDVLHGDVVPTPVLENDDPLVFSPNIPAAEEYAWNNKGELMPQTHALTRSTGIGSTNGDPSFTVWQPGGVELVKQDQSGGTLFAPGIFVWVVNFITWSPDGRYLINGAFLAARLEPPGHPRPDNKTLFAFHMEDLPVLPIRDAALLSALKLLSSAQTIGTLYHMIVSWSPNGQLMGMTTYEFLKKNLYSTKRGYPVATLQAPKADGILVQSSHNGYYAFSYPIWSPDGTHILAQDPATNAAVVWNIPRGLK